MPRINTRKVEMNEVPRFCPNCGAANTTASLRCTICGHRFASADAEAGLWDANAQNQAQGDEDFAALYGDTPMEPVPIPVVPVSDIESTKPFSPVADPWSSVGGRLGADPSTGKAFVPPTGSGGKSRTSGPPGWLLGILGVLLILGVAAIAAWFVAQPLVSDEISDGASNGIEKAIADVTIVAPVSPGSMVVSESDVNRLIRENPERFEPVEEIQIQIRRSGIEAQLEVYGISTTLTGTVDVEDGKIVIVDPQLSGVANRFVDLDDIVPRAESAINDLLARNNLEATSVTLSDDTMTIETEPATP